MVSLSDKCMDKDTVDSFCGCMAGEERTNQAAQAFCNRAKTDKTLTPEDLADLKMALLDEEDESCCECGC